MHHLAATLSGIFTTLRAAFGRATANARALADLLAMIQSQIDSLMALHTAWRAGTLPPPPPAPPANALVVATPAAHARPSTRVPAAAASGTQRNPRAATPDLTKSINAIRRAATLVLPPYCPEAAARTAPAARTRAASSTPPSFSLLKPAG